MCTSIPLVDACRRAPSWPSRRSPPPRRPNVTSPKQFFGFNIGDDYWLANYKQLAEYWHKLERESDRMKVVDIGKTEEGRPQLMADRHLAGEPQEARPLQGDRAAPGAGRGPDRRPGARARGGRQGGRLDRRRPARHRSARRAAADRDGLPAGQPHRRRDAPHPRRRRSSCACTPIPTAWTWSPTGTCARRTRRSGRCAGLPRLYQKYVGHDNNRDFYCRTRPRRRT